MSKEKSCCLTGHRPQSLSFGFNEEHPDCLILKAELKKQITEMITTHKVSKFLSRCDIGVEIFAIEIVLELKKDYPNIQLEAALPCETQADRWSIKDRERYFNLLPLCDTVTYINKRYSSICTMECNKYLVNNSDYVIAVWNGKANGIAKTVAYARSLEKNIFIITP